MRNYLDRYVLERDVSPGYASQLRYSLDRFERWIGRPPTLADLHEEQVNRWIIAMLESGDIERITIRNYRRNLLVLWRAAFDDRLTDVEPRRIRKVKVDQKPPQSPSPEEVANLLAVSQKLMGRFKHSGVNKAAFWRAFILTAWDTGLRLGDLCALKMDHIGPDGRLVITQHKTGWPIVCRLEPETIAAIEVTFPPNRERIFGDALCRDQVMRHFKLLREASGLLSGGTKLLRKASATAVEISNPGAAMAHLGHKTPGLAYKHYVDLAKVQQMKPKPPKLA